MSEIKEGILPLWKEKGMTSFDCVFKVRRLLGIKKVGHAGTLDPDVEGVLPLAIGKATKVLEYMLETDKTYTGEVTLGFSTATEDASGTIIERSDVAKYSIAETTIDQLLTSFKGEIQQTPPMFSAVKVAGKRLYEYAFAGEEIERPTRTVQIYDIKRTSSLVFEPTEKTAHFTFEVTCSKGTYIRTLAVDIGKKLGYPAHMSQLTRTQSGPIHAEQTVTLSEIKAAVAENTVEQLLLPLDYALTDFPKLEVRPELWKRIKNGSLLSVNDIQAVAYPILFTYQKQAIAIYDLHPTKAATIKPKKVFRTEM